MKNKTEGITLIALIITIIVLIILAGITLRVLTGENGILRNANMAKEEHGKQKGMEQIHLVLGDDTIEREITGDILTLDRLVDIFSKKSWVNIASKVEAESKIVIVNEEGYIYDVIIKEGQKVDVEYVGKGKGPIVKEIKVIRKDTSSIEIEVEAINAGGATYRYSYKKEGETEYIIGGESNSNRYKYEGLESNKIYDIKVEVIDKAGNVTTKNITVTTISYPIIGNVVKVGDYVAYSPDPVTVTLDTQIIKDLKTYSGYAGTEYNTENHITQENLSWRVLDIVNGQVTLISDTPTESSVHLQDPNGYNNAVKLLDELCNSLYSKKEVGVARSLKIEDIEDKLTYDYTKYENSYVDIGLYGGKREYTTNRYYPNIFAKEKTATVDGKVGIEYGLSEQNSYITGNTRAKTSIIGTQTYWSKNILASDFKDYNSSTLESIYYKLFINNGSSYNPYWFSSRCVYNNYDYTHFGVYRMTNGNVDAIRMYYSHGTLSYGGGYIRPIVILSSDVKIDITDTKRNGSTQELAWVLK